LTSDHRRTRRLEAFRLSVLNTVLVFVVIPLAIVLVVAALARAGDDSGRQSRRYRPGRPYEFTPMWFLAAPERVSPAIGGRTSEQTAQPPAIESGIIEDSSGNPRRPGPTGGASDRW
jgi:hypothetical protein